MEEAQNTRPDLTGRFVNVTGFDPGHALYLVQGTVEGYENGLAQVLIESTRARSMPNMLQGRLINVDPARLEPARRRR